MGCDFAKFPGVPDATEPDAPPVDLTSAPDADDKVAKLEAQVHDYKLLVADLQTSARRLNDDAAKQRKYFAEPFARDVLSLVDNLERSAEAAKAKGEGGVLLGFRVGVAARGSVRWFAH